MRAAAVDQPTRAEHFEAMAREAHRLQSHAGFEVRVGMTMGKKQHGRKHMQTDSETDPEPDPDAARYEEPFPEYDVTNPESLERLYTAPPPRKKPHGADAEIIVGDGQG